MIQTRKLRLVLQGSTLAVVLAMLQGCPGPSGVSAPSSLYNIQEKIGFPTATGAMNAPDGLATDSGWTGAYSVRLEDGGPTAAATIKGVSDADNIYLYAEVEDNSFTGTDALVLGFNATNTADGYRKLVIYPCKLVGGAVCSPNVTVTPNVDSQNGSTGSGSLVWGAVTSGAPPAGITVASRASAGGVVGKWSVEIRMDKSDLSIPATNFFGLFVDAIATTPGGFGMAGTANNFSWPTGTRMSDNAGNVLTANMQVPRWGNATIDATKFDAGLQITGFSTNGLDPSKISLTQANRFFATVANYPFGNGSEARAENVSATFQLNNIGLNPSWTWLNVPTTNNPTTAVPIDPRNYKVLSPSPWTLLTSGTYQTSGKTERQFFTDNPHQCVMVNVTSSNNPSVSRQINMSFVTVNSPFDSVQQIATGAWRKEYKSANAVYLTELFFNVDKEVTWKSELQGAKQLDDHLWTIDKFGGETDRLRLSVLPSERLQLPLDDYELDVGRIAKGEAVDIKIQPGSVLTLMADGEAKANGEFLTPWGVAPKRDGKPDEPSEGAKDLLRPGVAISDGTLVGSFDDFRTSFAIGSGTTLYVPANAQSMKVKLAGKLEGAEGRWVMQAVHSAPTGLMFEGLDIRKIRELQQPLLLPLGINLPFHVVRGMLDTGETIEIGGERFNVTIPMGSFGHYVYRVNRGELFPSGPVRPTRPGLGTIDIREIRPEIIRDATVINRRGDGT